MSAVRATEAAELQNRGARAGDRAISHTVHPFPLEPASGRLVPTQGILAGVFETARLVTRLQALHPRWLPIAQRFKVGVLTCLTPGPRYHPNPDPRALAHAVRGRARTHAAVRNYLSSHVMIGPAIVFRSAVNPGPSLLRAESWPQHILRGHSTFSMRLWLNK